MDTAGTRAAAAQPAGKIKAARKAPALKQTQDDAASPLVVPQACPMPWLCYASQPPPQVGQRVQMQSWSPHASPTLHVSATAISRLLLPATWGGSCC